MSTNDVIAAATIEGNLLRLPPDRLDRKEYQDVAKALNLIGGKWTGGKTQAFVFPSDPRPLVDQLLAGEKITSAKKEFQFFTTPAALADRLVELAAPIPGERILEPSAGQGAIVQAIQRRFLARFWMEADQVDVECFELMPINREILQRVPGVTILGEDFMDAAAGLWDCIIANPPFTKNQDIDHVLKMWDALAPGGRIVTIMSPHWTFAQGCKEEEFRRFLKLYSTDVEEIPAGPSRNPERAWPRSSSSFGSREHARSSKGVHGRLR